MKLITEAQAIFVAFQAAWPVMLPFLILLSSALSTVVVKITNHPKEVSFVHSLIGALSWAEHQDVGGWKWPLQTLTRPVVGSPVSPVGQVPTVLKLLLLCALLPHLTACAAISFASPVFFAGPAVAPIEEISKKNPTPAVAGGFQATIGLGQFVWSGKEWDLLDLSALALGGVVLPGSAPVGALQLGGEIGTLNGIIGLGVLATPYTADGGGFLQGGSPGTTFAGVLNIQALVAYFSTPSGTEFRPRLPRGGLGDALGGGGAGVVAPPPASVVAQDHGAGGGF